jgi:hypothetical protein
LSYPGCERLEKTEIEKQRNELNEVGEIIITVHRIKVGKLTSPPRHTDFHEFDLKVHEIALKGETKSHGIA